MPEELDIPALLTLCEKATLGPWQYNDDDDCLETEATYGGTLEDPVAETKLIDLKYDKHNQRFVLAARTALPLALAKIAELQRELVARDHLLEGMQQALQERDSLKRHLDAIAEALGQPSPGFPVENATRADGWYWVRPSGWADFQPARYVVSSCEWHCIRCGTVGPVQAHHHHGYDNALDVEWICDPCHRAEHAAARAGDGGKAGE